VVWIEVLNQHECHAGIVRQMAQQLRECLQSAGGGSHANSQGASTAAGRTVAIAEAALRLLWRSSLAPAGNARLRLVDDCRSYLPNATIPSRREELSTSRATLASAPAGGPPTD